MMGYSSGLRGKVGILNYQEVNLDKGMNHAVAGQANAELSSVGSGSTFLALVATCTGRCLLHGVSHSMSIF